MRNKIIISLIFVVIMFFSILLHEVCAILPEGISEEFKAVLNEEGKFVITDTENGNNKESLISSVLNNYSTDEYKFRGYFKDAECTKCAIERYQENPYQILEHYEFDVEYEEKFSDEFNKVAENGKMVITSSTTGSKKVMIDNYLKMAQGDGQIYFNIGNLNEEATKGTLLRYKDGKVIEQHIVEISYEEKFSDKFKEILKDGKIIIRASRETGRENLVYNYCYDYSNEEYLFNYR